MPTKGPTTVTGGSFNSTALQINWTSIPTGFTHGIIISYIIRYQRTDGFDAVKTATVENQTGVLTGLEKYTSYTIEVAGMTIKGTGTFSSSISITTNEDSKDLQLISYTY